jgi:hypothetical protein
MHSGWTSTTLACLLLGLEGSRLLLQIELLLCRLLTHSTRWLIRHITKHRWWNSHNRLLLLLILTTTLSWLFLFFDNDSRSLLITVLGNSHGSRSKGILVLATSQTLIHGLKVNTLTTIRGTLLIHIWRHKDRIWHLKTWATLTCVGRLTDSSRATGRHWLLLLITRLSSRDLLLRGWRSSDCARSTHIGSILLILTSISTSSMFILLILRLNIFICAWGSSLMHLIDHELTLRYV